jgi:putative transposase
MAFAPLLAMAYLPRCKIVSDDSYFHVTWQCHNKDWLLRWNWAKQLYYDLLLKFKDKYGIIFYSYNFMDNHPHLVGHLETRERFSRFFQVVNSQFSKRVNKRLGRRGQVIMDRFKSPTIESDKHMMTVMAYVDLNQHRAGKVKHPQQNRWSSYRYYAHGRPDPLLTPCPSYLALGDTPEERQREYRIQVEGLMAHREMLNISQVQYIGDPDWVLMKYQELSARLGRNITPVVARRMTGPPS